MGKVSRDVSHGNAEQIQHMIDLGIKFRGEAFKRTKTYRSLTDRLMRLKVREVWR
jgi:hypothetical protein